MRFRPFWVEAGNHEETDEHEAVINVVWDSGLKPLLLEKFPNAAPDELRGAHAYAPGGSIIQDMGYYPIGAQP